MIQKLINLFKRPYDLRVGPPDDPYLLRWWIIPKNKLFNVFLHYFMRDDDDRALHDHPWVSLSIVLTEGYLDFLPGNKVRLIEPLSVVFRSAEYTHRIVLNRDENGKPKPVWTIFITGPKFRQWGFYCPKGWVHSKVFLGNANKAGSGCS